jgi:hypothetical protein
MQNARFSTIYAVAVGPLQGEVECVIRLLDELLSPPMVPLTPVRYHATFQPFGRYVPGDGYPDHISLSEFGPHPQLTLAHETGHLLDQAMVWYNAYASMNPDGIMAPVLLAMRQSTACRNLERIAEDTNASLLARRSADYWRGMTECWARAFAQWVAERSGDVSMLSELETSRALEVHEAAPSVQWDRQDFVSVAAALDTLFSTLGWLK